MRAIHSLSVLYLTASFALGACSPNLARQAGSLQIDVPDPPATTDALRAVITAGLRTFTTEAPPQAGILIESVPAGEVQVEVEALAGGIALDRRAASTIITAGETTRLTIRFGRPGSDAGVLDGGTQIVTSAPIPAFLRALEDNDISGGILRDVAELDTTAWSTFLQSAASALGHAPTSLRVVSATVSLNVAASTGANSLDDLFAGDAIVTIASRQSPLTVDVARGPCGSGLTQVELPVLAQSALDGMLTDLLGGRFDVQLAGPAAPTPTFRAELSVLTTWTAR